MPRPKKTENKVENREAVAAYHKDLTTIRIRFPAADVIGIDYLQMIKDRAKEKGFQNSKGIDKGEGNINAYVLDLIEKDLGIEMTKRLKGLDRTKKES